MVNDEPEISQDLDFDIILESLHYDYRDSQNVLICWKALSYCLENAVPIPSWVKLYFLAATEELLRQ